ITYSWGNEVGRGKSNCKGCGSEWDLEKTAPVGSFRANTFGLQDMHGNVFEWTQDCFHDSYNGAPDDGSVWTIGGDCGRHFVRGGGWDVGPEDIRSARRWVLNTSYRSGDVGFRVARALTGEPQH